MSHGGFDIAGHAEQMGALGVKAGEGFVEQPSSFSPMAAPWTMWTMAAAPAGFSATIGAEDLRREFARQVLGARAHRSSPGAPITCRTSIGCWIGTPPGPGAADACAAISMARFSDSTSTIR